MPMLTVRLTEEENSKLDTICDIRQMTPSQLIHNFIKIQYDLVNSDSQINKTISNIENLKNELEKLTIQISQAQ